MNQPINDGGPAFPVGPTAGTMKPHPDGGLVVTHYGMEGGMTLRDYFAAAALQGLWANPHVKRDGDCRESVACFCYEQADAMIDAREAKP